jgi:nucleoside-diphosphate-sugar epimerase
MSKVLVTGGSGFIGSHCILALLAAGHRVRATVRSLERAAEVRAALEEAGQNPGLSFAAADLERDEGWQEAVAGNEYVLHVASPFPARSPAQEDDLIVPAREGTLRVLRAARDSGVRRVVITSSFAAIGYGYPPQQAPFDETYWSNIDGTAAAYVKSKTLAERAAWDFIAHEGDTLELAVVNPVAVLGPVLNTDFSASIEIVRRMLTGGMPAAPHLMFGVVDVRDVADMHLRAMTHPAARGERFLAAAGDFMSLLQISQVLRARLGTAAKRAPTRSLPDWVLRATALFNPTVRELLPELGKTKNGSHEKASRLLGWAPRSNEDAIVATAESLLRLDRR